LTNDYRLIYSIGNFRVATDQTGTEKLEGTADFLKDVCQLNVEGARGDQDGG
jgi:hypothetical protein